MGDIYLYTFDQRSQSRTEITTSLVFDAKNNRFQIRVSQDYETQAKIERSYSDADTYLANHPEHREQAREAVEEYMTKNPEHKNAMSTTLTQMKYL